MSAAEIGRFGEDVAAHAIQKAGYNIIGRNYRSRYGEIDIIANNKEFLVFVEVKTRSVGALSLPREAVDARKRNKILKTAMCYLKNDDSHLQPRFDVIEIIIENKENLRVNKINWIKNAF